MSLITASKSILKQMRSLVDQLSDDNYREPLEVFSGATIGQHSRHIIEFYQCVLFNLDKTCINYDLRERDLILENSVSSCIDALDQLQEVLEIGFDDSTIRVEGQLGGALNVVESSIMRELLYAIEHAVHHMAILKIGIITNFTKVTLGGNFGVAESTVIYKQKQES